MQPELKPVRTDDSSFGRGTRYEVPQHAGISADSARVLRNTYLLLEATATRRGKRGTPDSSDGGRKSRH